MYYIKYYFTGFPFFFQRKKEPKILFQRLSQLINIFDVLSSSYLMIIYTIAFSFTPKELSTLSTVSNFGFEPFANVLYKLSRPRPVSFDT